MESHSLCSKVLGLGLLLVAGTMAPPAAANPIVAYTLSYGDEGLDLDTGTVVPLDGDGFAADSSMTGADMTLAFNAERSIGAVVVPVPGSAAGVAFLDGVAFNQVDSDDLAGLTYSSAMIDKPFDLGDSVVIRTDTGAHYLVGNSIEGEASATFDTQLLDVTSAGLVRPPSREVRVANARPYGPEAAQEPAYAFRESPDGFAIDNPRHGLRAEFNARGLRVAPLDAGGEDRWTWTLRLASYGYAGGMHDVEQGEVSTDGNRLERKSGSLVEWYVNRGKGLEHGFTLDAPPTGERDGEPLLLRLVSGGSLGARERNDAGILLVDRDDRAVLHYENLVAWDASGRRLPASLSIRESLLSITVDDSGARYPVTVDPTIVTEDATLAFSPVNIYNNVGRSTDMEDGTAVIGAYSHLLPPYGLRAGAVHVLTGSGTTWTQQVRLTAPDAGHLDDFNRGLALSGNTIAVGSQLDDHAGGTDAGSVYIFTGAGATWTLEAKLVASDAASGDRFGYQLSLEGDRLVVGAIFDDNANGVDAGSVYVFERSGTTWTEQAKLTASDGGAGDSFGYFNALSGDTFAVGARLHDHAAADAGAAYVFRKIGPSWTEEAELMQSDAEAGDGLGCCVGALDGDTLIVPAPTDDNAAGVDAGAAYVFVRSGTTWTEQAKLIMSDSASADGILVWDLDGDTACLGSLLDDYSGFVDAGSAYIYQRTGTTWAEQRKLVPSDPQNSGQFGICTMDAGVAIVGARYAAANGKPGSGKVYAYLINQPPTAVCTDPTVSANAECLADATVDAGSSDPDGDPITLAQDPTGLYDLGATAVVLTVEDDKGAADTCAATVTVVDDLAPSISCPASLTLECPAATDPAATGSAEPSDNCSAGAALVITASDATMPLCGPTESIVRTWTATDAAGNATSCEQTITEADTVAPVLVVDPPPQSVDLVDSDCSGDESVSLPSASGTDACDPASGVSVSAFTDGGDPVMVGTAGGPTPFPAGATTTVAYTATDACGNTSGSSLQVAIDYGADIFIEAAVHTVGAGSHPASTKEPLVGIEVCAYDKSEGSCAQTVCGGISHQHYACIAEGDATGGPCAPANCCTTDANGEGTINVPPGDYVVISTDSTKTVLPDPLGVSASDLACGELMQKHLQQIVRGDGKKVPGKTRRLTGSELLIIEPEFIVWDDVEQSYPFVFETIGDWSVTASVEPPEGFVADYESLDEDVDNEIEAVQFTISEIGSDLVPTQTTFEVLHRGRATTVRSDVGILLTPAYALSRGFDVRDLRTRGLIRDSDPAPGQRPGAPRAPRRDLEDSGEEVRHDR